MLFFVKTRSICNAYRLIHVVVVLPWVLSCAEHYVNDCPTLGFKVC